MNRIKGLRLLFVTVLSVISLMRCGCGTKANDEIPGLKFVTPSKEAVLTHLVDVLHIVKSNEENMCGMFSTTKDISVGEIIKKTDKDGGTYTYSLKTYDTTGNDPILNAKTNTTLTEPLSHVKTGASVFVHEFKNYSGNLKRMPDAGPIIQITGEIIGTQWDKEKGTMRLDGGLGINTLGISDKSAELYHLNDTVYETENGIKNYGKNLSYMSFHIRHLGIDNGTDGNKRGKLDSLVKLSSEKSYNEIFLSDGSIKISIQDKNNSKYKDWLQQFISCDNSSSISKGSSRG